LSKSRHIPRRISIHKQSKQVDIQYRGAPSASGQENAHSYQLSAEYLRVFSPSAEVQKHGNPELQFGKKEVTIVDATLIGLYGIKFQFDDGHNTGIYSWPYLADLCQTYEEKWQSYIEQLHRAGKSREQDTSVVKFFK